MIKAGMFLSGRYEILDKIGSGGMSDVYRAKDHKLNRYVAVKVLKSEFNSDLSFISRFRTEAHAAASLSHPNIVNVYDVGDEDDLHYIVMELVDGITLKTYIAKKGKLEIRETIGIAMQVAQGLEAAHAQHIVHRDVKPQNVMISRDGKVKVTDFGIAKASTAETVTVSTMGSVHYISPEQARGGYCDERSDIYSLGITMYEMLTGRVPFDGDSAVSVALLHIQGEMVPPSTYEPLIPVSLEKIVLKCTQKKPELRYASVTALIADLKHSLMAPNEDFVVIATGIDDGATRVMSADEMEKIRSLQDDETVLLSDIDDGMEEKRYQLDQDDEDQTDPDEDEEDDGDSRSDRIYTIIGIVIAVLIVILALFVLAKTFGLFDGGSSSSSGSELTDESDASEVTMIDLIGMTVDEAEEALAELDLEMKLSYSESSEYDDGIIMEQEYEEGEVISRYTVVKVTVSRGTTETTVPTDLIGMTREEALEALYDADLNAEFSTIYSDDVDEGYVAKVSPGLGSTVTVGDTVTCYISLGPEDTTVEVPSVVGYSQSNAETAIENAGLEVGEVTTEYSSEYDAGYVISQSVKAGTSVDEGTEVDLVVSLGTETTEVPNVVGKTLTNATTYLENNDLEVGEVTYEYSDTVDEGYVISQSETAGSMIASGSEVDLVVSKGADTTEVPNVVGQTLTNATNTLTDNGLSVGSVTYEYSDTVAEDCVISQSETAGSTVSSGSSVDLVISLGQEPTEAADEEDDASEEE